MTENLPPEQSTLDRVIVDELFETIPDGWNAFVMTIEPRFSDGDGVAISILNPDVAEASIEPTAEIRKGVDDLVAYFAREKRHWERLTYQAFADEAGTWRLKITAPLPPREAAAPPA